MTESHLINQVEKFYAEGNYKSALKYANNILKKDDKNIFALVIKGNIFFQNQNYKEALENYLVALQIDSQNKNIRTNIANCYFELKNYKQAYLYSKEVIKDDPQQKSALIIFGNTCLELEKYDEAKEAFLTILQMDSSDAWTYNSLSRLYQKTGDKKRSLAHGWKAVETSNGDDSQHLNFGYLLYETGSDFSKQHAKNWLTKYGSNSIVKHMANALLHQEKISQSDTCYIRQLFDEFAEDFDNVLESLDYRAPQLIVEEIQQKYTSREIKKITILDIGCGTGLCGKFLSKNTLAKSIYGIDISEKMLKKAAQKKCYKKLICNDIITYLASNTKKYDLIIAADVLTYFGDLRNIFEKCFQTLSKNGRIILTISKNNINDSDYYLHPSGRFLHHENYLKTQLKNNGFLIENITEKILRYEGEKQVIGDIVSAIKKA